MIPTHRPRRAVRVRRRAPLARRGVRRAVVPVLLAAVAAAALAACRPPPDRTAAASSDVQVQVRVPGDPVRIGPATIEVEVRRGDGPVDGASVTVTGDMTHAGMVPVVDGVAPLGAGLYRTSGFRFTMAGDWVLTVDVVLPDGSRRHAEAALRVEP